MFMLVGAKKIRSFIFYKTELRRSRTAVSRSISKITKLEYFYERNSLRATDIALDLLLRIKRNPWLALIRFDSYIWITKESYKARTIDNSRNLY
jgi:hypothetical protein